MKNKIKQNWKLWAKKLGINLALAIVTGLIIMWQSDPKYIVVIPLLLALQNWIKHR